MNKDIQEVTLEELKLILKEWGKPDFGAQQIFFWIYQKGIQGYGQMSNLSRSLREMLKDKFDFFVPESVASCRSRDGTEKFLLKLKDKNLIETVLIPAYGRITGCISTQAGCKFSCRFCASGLSGFKRDLTCAEIISQALFLKRHSAGYLSHLVFMGTGEPLDNYANVIKAIRIINSPAGMNIGARKITISTAGLAPGIKKLQEEALQIELSISLHSADDATRSQIMPINNKYPLEKLMAACREYIEKTNRQITFEYILIKGLNSSLKDAGKLATIMKGIRLCKINLIPANIVREYGILPPSTADILLFRDYLLKAGINAIIRKPRGQDILAACGQLRLKYEE